MVRVTLFHPFSFNVVCLISQFALRVKCRSSQKQSVTQHSCTANEMWRTLEQKLFMIFCIYSRIHYYYFSSILSGREKKNSLTAWHEGIALTGHTLAFIILSCQ